MARKMILLILTLALLTGCHQRPDTDEFRVVTRITVTCESHCDLTRRTYIREDKMRPILNALRLLGHRFKPETDPETLNARTWCITLTHSDGSQHLYRIKGSLYIQENRDPWQQADAEKLMELALLIQQLPGDDPTDGPRQAIPRRNLPFDISRAICYYNGSNLKGRTICPTSSRSLIFLPRSWTSTPG